MPQKKSYFALQLPKGWWIFGLDLALHSDIDIYQFKFFSELIRDKVSFLYFLATVVILHFMESPILLYMPKFVRLFQVQFYLTGHYIFVQMWAVMQNVLDRYVKMVNDNNDLNKRFVWSKLLFTFDAHTYMDSPKILYFWGIRHAPAVIYEEPEQYSLWQIMVFTLLN